YDTLWTPGPSFPVNNQSVWIGDAQLWIEGEVYGKQTWGCADTIFIVGDITYANTTPGQPPDVIGSVNETDYFGLVSEQKILIRYKHRDPFEYMELVDQNCYSIMLYGAYAAIGQGDESLHGVMVCHYDGIFTFQYHHPHGSTPNFRAPSPYTGNDTLYDYVDLHKYIFPQNNVPANINGFNLHGNNPVGPYNTCGYPYEDPGYIFSFPNNNPSNYAFPYGTDYPWYNPVWPESAEDIVFERGIITIFGAIAQRRRGFVHRSGGDPYNHPNNYDWEMDEYHYDGTHPTCGYNKDYHFDERFRFIQPPDYPQIYEGWGASQLTAFTKQSWSFKSPPTD
ncbi:MAG: hypothetical protein KAU01_01910, partial [Candidatus Cloacimonetes bacterium]|nr:hypothetical protein [Candidatus Cloacimonadota bacterium]